MKTKNIARAGLTVVILSCLAAPLRAVELNVGSLEISPGASGTFNVTLNNMGQQVAGTDNCLSFDPAVPIASCEVNPAIRKNQTVFDFDSVLCTPVQDLPHVRALVLSIADTRPIPNGVVLYTCQVDAPSDARDGNYPLTCTNPDSSDPLGQGLDTSCTDGQVTVVRGVSLAVGDADVNAGETTSVEVTLDPKGADVRELENRIGFDLDTPIVSCAINSALGNANANFQFEPGGCTPGVDCNAVHATVQSTSAIPAGAVYTCSFDVPADASNATFPLSCFDQAVADADGRRPTFTAECSDGELTVGGGGGGGGGGGSCEIVGRGAGDSRAWLLLAPLSLIVLARRRRRPS